MCLIIASEKGILPTRRQVERAASNNADGYGIMWFDKRIRVNRGFKIHELHELLPNIEGKPYVLHFRLATHGGKNTRNLHPFQITPHLWMAHNGIINLPNKLTRNSSMSDTWNYGQIIKDTLTFMKDAKAEGLPDLITRIEEEVGNYNKLVFMRDDGKIIYANYGQGYTLHEEKMWLSNNHSLGIRRYGHRGGTSVTVSSSTTTRTSTQEIVDEALAAGFDWESATEEEWIALLEAEEAKRKERSMLLLAASEKESTTIIVTPQKECQESTAQSAGYVG